MGGERTADGRSCDMLGARKKGTQRDNRDDRDNRVRNGTMHSRFIPPHGGYKHLISYQRAEIVYDATVYFCDHFIDRRSRTHDQMIQAARSGKQNIIECSMAAATSKETEIKLT